MEREVFLVSELGAFYLGTVEELLHPEEPLADFNLRSGIADIVSEIAFDENHLSNSMALSIELRELREKSNGV